MALWWPGRHRLILTMQLQVFKIILHNMGQTQDVRQIRPVLCQSETWGRLARGSERFKRDRTRRWLVRAVCSSPFQPRDRSRRPPGGPRVEEAAGRSCSSS